MRLPALALLPLLAPTLAAEPVADRQLSVTLERLAGESWAAVEPGRVLEQGDQVRFRIASNLDGRLYVFNRNAEGASNLIFPREEIGADNALAPNHELLLPPGGDAFEISGPPGYEVVRWVVSPSDRPLGRTEIARFLAPPTASRPRPPLLAPSCDDTVLRSRSICVDNQAGAQSFADAPPGLAARAIEIGGDEKTAVVSASTSQDGVLVFEYRIAHR
ncbi:MAG: DUF4384 domain-containing protein [Acidobacteria bacterium]|nr:DUF4384 domain-containing protein [Acidobacteriota bacterium]